MRILPYNIEKLAHEEADKFIELYGLFTKNKTITYDIETLKSHLRDLITQCLNLRASAFRDDLKAKNKELICILKDIRQYAGEKPASDIQGLIQQLVHIAAMANEAIQERR